jgi:hypothetical protein
MVLMTRKRLCEAEATKGLKVQEIKTKMSKIN